MLQEILEKFYILEDQEKLFTAEYTDEAEEQLLALEDIYYDRITTAIKTFELVGTKYKNINDLGNGLFEIKPKDVHICLEEEQKKRKLVTILISSKESEIRKITLQNISKQELKLEIISYVEPVLASRNNDIVHPSSLHDNKFSLNSDRAFSVGKDEGEIYDT